MTTHELARELLKQPDIKVVTYNSGEEAYGDIVDVDLYTELDELPYAKDDPPTMPEEGLVIIQGYTAN